MTLKTFDSYLTLVYSDYSFFMFMRNEEAQNVLRCVLKFNTPIQNTLKPSESQKIKNCAE